MASVPSGADIRRLEDTVLEQAENNREHVEDQVKALETQLLDAVMADKTDLVGALKAQIAELKDELAHRTVAPGGGGGGGGGVVVNIVNNAPPPPAPAAPASILDRPGPSEPALTVAEVSS